MASKLTCLAFLCILFFLFTLSKGSIHNDTIKRLQSSRKGSKVEGLHDVKLYLARFGYLNDYHHTPNHVNAQDDEFDDELEAALKTYQTFYHLNASGSLDGPTISQMFMPRCGQPDHVKQAHHQHGTKLLHTVSHYAFFQNNLKWPPTKTHLTYAFGPDYPNAYIAPVVQAFETWASASAYFTFSNVDDIESADLKISFKRGDHGDGYPFGGVLAHAFAPTDGRFHYNADFKWSVGPGPVQDAYDLGSVALHEIGHLLGLDHSEDPNATMYSSIPPATIKGLNSDDIQGIKVLYGVPN